MTASHVADLDTINPQLAELFEELTNRLQNGESFNFDDYVRQHPAHADQLRQFLPAIEVLIGLGQSMAGSPSLRSRNMSGALDPAGVLGDFRILREIGRGGMGVVYEADQISLSRRVALKVLPFAAMLDQRQLSRFKLEAQAAAQLHHQNIVPVHAVGSERGVHYYAMQYIDGQTLAELIAGLRREADSAQAPHDPLGADHSTLRAARDAASTRRSISSDRLSAILDQLRQVAEALEYAHQEGVVHRDIKPSNLILDNRGKLWITDFGLARIDAGVTLTAPGDVLGTLRYMSPEQALGKRCGVDHRTDVYALGATLYEWLSLEPVFNGNERQVLLRQIAQDEPRPLRQINRDLPAELETIVHKALSKDVTRRYGSSGELADDLRRFLEHKPIHAKPPTVFDRVRKWCRRHESIVWSVGAISLLASVSLAISTAVVSHERSIAIQQRDVADAERQRADANYREAIRAVDTMSSVALDLDAPSHIAEGQRRLIEGALKFYRTFVADSQHDPQRRIDRMHAQIRVCNLELLLGRTEPAESAARKALALLRQRPEEFRTNSELRIDLAGALLEIGNILRTDPVRSEMAEEWFRESVDLADAELAQNPDDIDAFRIYAAVHHGYGYYLWSSGRLLEAEQQYRQSLKSEQQVRNNPRHPPFAMNHEFASAWNSLGLLQRLSFRPREAASSHREALRLLERVPAALITRTMREELARGHCHLGYALSHLDRLPEAESCLRTTITLREDVCSEIPNQSFTQELSLSYLALASLLAASNQATERTTEAEAEFLRALSLQQSILDRFKISDEPRSQMAVIRLSFGKFLARIGRTDEAISEMRSVLEIHPDTAESHNDVAWALVIENNTELSAVLRPVELAKRATFESAGEARYWTTLGAAHCRSGQWPDAISAFKKSDALLPDETGFNALFLAMAQWGAGDRTEARQTYRQATAWLAENKRYSRILDRTAEEARELLADSGN